MRAHELTCIHGVGHSSDIHGCDGCCGPLVGVAVDAETDRIIALIERRRCSENGQTHDCLRLSDYQADDLIALIKGEN